jgi:1-acyl-sn-glycerol-3-phosphate acyltransferase
MKILKTIYSVYCAVFFFSLFFVLFPFFVLFIQRDKWHYMGHFLNRLWAVTFFTMVFQPSTIVRHFKRKKNQAYVYCSNHTSYLDIPALAFAIPGHFLFVGKASLGKVPMFGYMFRNLYISVNRKSNKGLYQTLEDSCKAIDKNRSVAMFPEATIPQDGWPKMIPFKDGPFRIAIEKQIPVVPVTFPYNWIILPNNGGFLPNRHEMVIVIHEAIETKGMTMANVEELKQKTFDIINAELKKYNKNLIND